MNGDKSVNFSYLFAIDDDCYSDLLSRLLKVLKNFEVVESIVWISSVDELTKHFIKGMKEFKKNEMRRLIDSAISKIIECQLSGKLLEKQENFEFGEYYERSVNIDILVFNNYIKL